MMENEVEVEMIIDGVLSIVTLDVSVGLGWLREWRADILARRSEIEGDIRRDGETVLNSSGFPFLRLWAFRLREDGIGPPDAKFCAQVAKQSSGEVFDAVLGMLDTAISDPVTFLGERAPIDAFKELGGRFIKLRTVLEEGLDGLGPIWIVCAYDAR